jgi:hypothetical protein
MGQNYLAYCSAGPPKFLGFFRGGSNKWTQDASCPNLMVSFGGKVWYAAGIVFLFLWHELDGRQFPSGTECRGELYNLLFHTCLSSYLICAMSASQLCDFGWLIKIIFINKLLFYMYLSEQICVPTARKPECSPTLTRSSKRSRGKSAKSSRQLPWMKVKGWCKI